MTRHLDALNLRLSRELIRLANADNQPERELRTAWVDQIEKEIARENEFLEKNSGYIKDNPTIEMSDDELLAALAS